MKPTRLSPSEFAFQVLGLDLYDWNIDALEAAGAGKWTAVAAANGSGKTTYLIAALILWFLNRYPRGQIPVTSGSFNQVELQLWQALETHRGKFLDWKWNNCYLETPEGGFAVGFSTDKAGRAEGWHPKVSNDVDPVLWIVDEAKTVPDPIFQSIDRCTRIMQLFTSSPGADGGQFYRCFHSEKSLYHTLKVTSMDCPHIDPKKRERDRLKYGEDSPIFRSMHLAEFTSLGDSVILSPETLSEAMSNQPPIILSKNKRAFCDFAAGGDENVLALKSGNRIWIEDAWHDVNTTRACRRFVEHFKRLGLTASSIYGDNTGLGHVMIDHMADLGWRINRVDNGSAANDAAYANRGSEIWYEGARAIARNQFVLDLDPTTCEQLTARRKDFAPQRGNPKSILKAESKDDMASRGVTSPDRADAVMGVIEAPNSGTVAWSEEALRRVTQPKNPFAVKAIRF